MKHVIALDVSKGKSTIAIYDGYRQCEFEGELYHTRIDFEQLHLRIKEITALDGQAPEIVFEATGVYSKSVEKFLRDHGHTYCRMNPLEANLQMASMRRHKTDISDAHELAKTHIKLERETTYVQNDYYEQMRAITRYYAELERAEKKAIVLLEAAKNSYPAIEPTDIRCNQVRDYARRIADLMEKKDQLVKQMVMMSEGRKEYTVLRSFPGIGDTTACRLIGELGDIRRFKNAKQLNAYVGIDIMRYQSGNTQYRDRINKRGNKKLRKILFFMICTMLMAKRKPNHLVDYYHKLKTQPQRKPHKVAIVACINKFLKVTFQLLTHGILYDYESALPAQKS
ncbi:IS110 family transposase [Bacillus salipaludis]|uniref:IS110 family transposase n=1 Tax=Bacillus salipaludis TaxID=2547811 RepID=UPI003D1CD13A